MIKKFMNLFKVKEEVPKLSIPKKNQKKKVKPTRIGELGEYKINIQLDQLPKDCTYLSDIMIKNSKSKTGYSQIDHIVISPYVSLLLKRKIITIRYET
ncbi:nuclease-related domain-containing protein [Paenibacillus psychroresistens]|uniref:nuclease-related domain-containing protein n=1 Tax=Paenibacillus psychroresistens TaxID=1778678 RepID=UPI003867AC5C